MNVKSLNHILTIEEGHYLIMSCCRSSACGWQEAVMSVWRTVGTSRGDLGDKCWKPLTKLRFLSPISRDTTEMVHYFSLNGYLWSKWYAPWQRSWHVSFQTSLFLMLQEQWGLGCKCTVSVGVYLCRWQTDCFRYKTVDLFPGWPKLNSHHQ